MHDSLLTNEFEDNKQQTATKQIVREERPMIMWPVIESK